MAQVAVRCSWLRSPATWAAVLSGLVVVSAVPMIPLLLLSREYFNGAVPLVIGVPCAVVGILVARRQPPGSDGVFDLVDDLQIDRQAVVGGNVDLHA